MSRDQSPLLPAEFHFVWIGRRCAGLPSDGYPSAYVSTVSLADVTPTDPTVPNLAGRSGMIRTVHGVGPALFSSATGDPTNKAALDAVAKKYAQDWFDFQTASKPGDVVYSGVVAPAPNALIDCVEWSYDRERAYTRLQSPALNDAPDRMGHSDPSVSGCADTAGITSDYAPGVLVDMPVGTGGPAADSAFGILRLEAGRLTITFFGSTSPGPCVCTVPPKCKSICIFISKCDSSHPPGMSVSLSRKGTITGLVLDDGGAGYTVPPFVTISAADGQYASVQATIDASGAVTSLVISNHGDSFVGPATVVFTPQNVDIGHVTRNAAAHVTIGDVTIGTCSTTGELWRVDIDCFRDCNSGRGYWNDPAVTISGNAKAHATRTGGQILKYTMTDEGSGYTATPRVVVTDQPASGTTGGSNALITANVNGSITGLTIINGGADYGHTQTPTIVLTGPGSGASFAPLTFNPITGAITTGPVAVLTGGTGYVPEATGVTFNDGFGVGHGAIGVAVVTGPIHSLTFRSSGALYQKPLIAIDPPPAGGTQATATIDWTDPTFVNDIRLQSIVVDDRGSGYSESSPPPVTIDPPTGRNPIQAVGKAVVATQCCVPIEEVGLYGLVLNSVPGGYYVATGSYTGNQKSIAVGDCRDDVQAGIGIRPDTVPLRVAMIASCAPNLPTDQRDPVTNQPFYSLPANAYNLTVTDYQGNTLGTMSNSGGVNTFDVSMPVATPPNAPFAFNVGVDVAWSGAWSSRMISDRFTMSLNDCPGNLGPFGISGALGDAVYQSPSNKVTPGYVCCGPARYPVPPTLHVSGGGSCTLHLVRCGLPLGYAFIYVGSMSIDSGSSRIGFGPPVFRSAYGNYNYCCPKPAGGNIQVQVIMFCAGQTGEYGVSLNFPAFIAYSCDFRGFNEGPCVWMTWDKSAWCGEVATDPSPVSPPPNPGCYGNPVPINLSGGGYLADLVNPPFDLTVTCVPSGPAFWLPGYPCDARPGMADQSAFPVPSVTLHITE